VTAQLDTTSAPHWAEYAARFFEPKHRRWATPGALARVLDKTTVSSPALDLLDTAIVELVDGDEYDALDWTMPPQEGKQIRHDELVPTPGGWRRHGDLQPGDYVFRPSGEPVRVLAVSADSQATYRVRFSDYASVTCHARHEWTVHDRARGAWRTMETAALARRVLRTGPAGRGGQWTFHLPAREPLQLPDAVLPVDPYTLGVWLGDGSSSKAAVTHHPDDEYVIAYPQSARCVHAGTGIVTTYYRGGMAADLKAAGLWRNKHIPAVYLRGSEKQRRELLAGLIDTDGHVSATGQVSFDNTDEQLVRATAELLRTLGYRAHVHRPTAPKLSSSGIQGTKPMWRVTYTPHDVSPARLARKASGKLGMRRRVAITAIEQTNPEPGRCITVDSPDGLYLVGEQFTPTHNSQRVSRRTPTWLLEHDPTLRIAIISYEQEMALRWGRDIKSDITIHRCPVADCDKRECEKLHISIRQDSSAAGRWETPQGGGVYCVGIGGPLTGKPVDIMIIDDPVKDRAAAESATIRKTTWDWWESVALMRLAPGSKVILIQTRWHQDDLSGRIQTRPSPLRWRIITIPAIADKQPDPLGRTLGEELRSVRGRAPGYFRLLRATVSAYVFASIHQQRPTAAEGNVFRRASYRYWRPAEPWPDGRARIVCEGMPVTLADCWIFATVDVAATIKTSADYTVIAVWCVSPSGDLILLDRIRDRAEMHQHFALADPLISRWPGLVLYIEKSFYSSTLVKDARDAGYAVAELIADTDKLTRALPAAGRVHAGRVWFPAETSGCSCGGCPAVVRPDGTSVPGVWLDEWCDELAVFPAGTNDDQVDTLSYAALVVTNEWTPARPPPKPGAMSQADRTIAAAHQAATGDGRADLDIMHAQW
jgi:phage terminase large subunit-like protein